MTPANAIETARQYLQRGWQVIPVRPRGKRPVDNEWPKLKITADTLPRYFQPNSNVGVVLGDVSKGLVDIDLDCPEAVELAPKFLPPSAEFGRASSRRSHRLFYCNGIRTEKFLQPMGVVDGKARYQMLVELRANKASENGEGLQTVFPGSTHPSGERIEWDTRDGVRAVEKVDAVTLRAQVSRLAASSLLVRLGWDKDKAIAFGRSPSEGALGSLTKANYSLVARWLGLAERPSDERERQDENKLKRAAAYLTKIGGAVSGAGGHQQTWSAALAVVRGFDLSESEAYALLSSDYNTRCDPPWTERELRHKIADAANNSRLERGYLLRQERPKNGRPAQPMGVVVPISPSIAAEWEAPIEFDAFDLPAFPVDALPSVLGDFVRGVSQATQTPLDLAGMMALSACAACAAKRAVVEVRPGYREPINLFTATILPPGERKTAVVNEAKAPLSEWEVRAAEEARPKITKAAQMWAISKKRLDAATDRAAKAKTKGECEQSEREVEDLTEQHARHMIPEEPRILADDATPEALGSLLEKHEGRIAILSDEGGIFNMMAGKYSDSPSLDVYLKAHAGADLRVDRKGRPSERVLDPALTLGLAIQPAILEAIAQKPLLRGTGLLARFLYALPTSMLGGRAIDVAPMPDAVRSAYATALRNLLVLQKMEKPLVMKLSPDAYRTWCEFASWLEPQLGEFGELASIRDWAGKLAGAVARISGVLGILRIVSLKRLLEDLSISIYIEQDEMVRAIALGKYLVPHAQAVFASMGASPEHQAAQHILGCIRRKAWPHFSRRDVQQSVRRCKLFDEAARLDRALTILTERRFIRLKPRMEQGPGRPSEIYEVNPSLISKYPEFGTQNPQNNGFTHIYERTPGEDDV